MTKRYCSNGHVTRIDTARYCSDCGAPLPELADAEKRRRSVLPFALGGFALIFVCIVIAALVAPDAGRTAAEPTATATAPHLAQVATTGAPTGTTRPTEAVTVPPPNTPAASPTATSEPTRTATAAPTATSTPCALQAAFVRDVTIPDDTEIALNTGFDKVWELRNVGACAWGADARLVYVGGDKMGAATEVSLPSAASGATSQVTVRMLAPAAPGTYTGRWRVCAGGGDCPGPTISVRIVVFDPNAPKETPTPVPPTPAPEPTSVLGHWYYSGKAAVAVSDLDRRSGIGYWDAESGYEFVSVGVYYANAGSSGTVHCNPYHFRLMTSQGVIYSHSWIGLEPDLQAVDLAPGAQTTGWVTFEIPVGSHGLQLVWDADLFADSVFILLE